MTDCAHECQLAQPRWVAKLRGSVLSVLNALPPSTTQPMTVHEYQLAQGLTQKPVKGMLTGESRWRPRQPGRSGGSAQGEGRAAQLRPLCSAAPAALRPWGESPTPRPPPPPSPSHPPLPQAPSPSCSGPSRAPT